MYKTEALLIAARQGHKAKEVPISLAAGASEHGVLLVPKNAQTKAVIILHGTGNDAFYCHAHVALALLSAGWHVALFNLPGHGRGGTSIMSPVTIAADVSGAIEQLTAALDLRTPPCLLGFSLGGALALAASAGLKDSIAKVITVGCPFVVRLGIGLACREAASLFHSAFWQRAREFGIVNMLPAIGPFRRRHYPIRCATGMPSGLQYVKIVNTILASIQSSLQATLRPFAPVMIFGELDRIAPPTDGDQWQSLIGHCKIVTLPKLSHFGLSLSDLTTESILSEL